MADRANFWRRVALYLALLWLLTASLALRLYLRALPGVALEPLPRSTPEHRLVLRPDRFDRLPGWRRDALGEALPALLESCAAIARLPGDRPLGPTEAFGAAAVWAAACAGLDTIEGDDEVRSFLEARFVPLKVLDGEQRIGLFTGYYEPTLRGSLRRRGPYRVPLYRRPPDLISIDLGRFRDDLRGRRIAARRVAHTLVPYYDRNQIVAGALRGRGLELAWVDDPVDAFFLQIQGSGRIELEEGGVLRVGYAGQNGQPYTAIGRELVERGALEPDAVSMQSIRAWLRDHPEAALEVMARNRSFVFFRKLPGSRPLGAQGVPLTAGRSLAVDASLLPLGAPVWLESLVPAPDGSADLTLRRLLVAQDTGGAIRGPVRGDVFWGSDEEAAAIAGRMRHRGRMWLLVPRAVPVAGASVPPAPG